MDKVRARVALESFRISCASWASEARGPSYSGLCRAAWAKGTAGTWNSDCSPLASACPLRDQGSPDGQPTPTEERQRSKRARSQQVLTGRRPGREGGGLQTRLLFGLPRARGLGKSTSLFHIPGADEMGWGEPADAVPSVPEGREGPVTGSPKLTLRHGPAQENPESQAQKRPCPSASTSLLAEAKDNSSASDHGTMNPMAQGSLQLPAPGISLKVAANVVVKCLTPFYKEGKFASKVRQVGASALPGSGTLGCRGGAGCVSCRGEAG